MNMRPFAEFWLLPATGLSPGVWAGTIAAVDRTGSRVDFRANTKIGEKTRARLAQLLGPLPLTWLSLQHGTQIVELLREGEPGPAAGIDARLEDTIDWRPPAQAVQTDWRPLADAALLRQPGTAVAFTTADCLPIVISTGGNGAAPALAVAVHAGWRSLADGIIEAALQTLEKYTAIDTCRAWIGPGIAASHFEISSDARDRLLQRPAIAACPEVYLNPTRPHHWQADLPAMAEAIMLAFHLSAQNVHRSELDTYTSAWLHSARRDGELSGRMASFCALLREETGAIL